MTELAFTRPDGARASIIFDATVDELHESSATITEHPVEVGAAITDHVRPNQDTLNMEAVISNTPVRVPTDGLIEGATGDVQELVIFSPNPPSRTGPPKLSNPGRPPVPSIPLAPGVGFLIRTLVPGIRPEWTPSPFVGDPGVSDKGANVLQFSQAFDRVRVVYAILLALKNTGTLLDVFTSLREYESMLLESVSAPRDARNGHSVQLSLVFRQIRLASSQTVAAPEPEELRARPPTNEGDQDTDEADETEEENAGFWYNIFFGS